MNSPRLPPVNRVSSSGRKGHIANRTSFNSSSTNFHNISTKFNSMDCNAYEEALLTELVKGGKSILPPLAQNGHKSHTSNASFNCKIIFKERHMSKSKYMCEIRILAFVFYQYSYIFQAIRDEKQHDRIWPAKRKLSSAKSLSSLHDAADRGK